MANARHGCSAIRLPMNSGPCGFGRLSLWFVLIAGGCSLSREAAFDPARDEIENRVGVRPEWRGGHLLERDVDNAVKALLADELTPDSAAQIALLNNRALQARFEDIGIARADVMQATLLVNPSLSAEVLFPLTANEFQGGVGLSFDFLSLAFRSAQSELAHAQLGATQLAIAGAAIDLTFEARRALLEVAGSQQVIDALETFVEVAVLSYEVAERLYAAGNITDFALLREQEVLASARVQLVAERGRLFLAQRSLQTALGLLDKAWKLPRRLPPIPAKESRFSNLDKRALERSIDLELTRRRVGVAGRALRLTDVRRYFPALRVGASAEKDDGLLAGPSLNVTLPIFDQGQGRIAAREAELRRLQEAYLALNIDLRAEAYRVREQLQLVHARAHLLRDEVLPLRQQILEQALLQYNAMTIGVLELLETKRLQLEAEVRWAEALRSAWMLQLAAEQLLAGRMPPAAVNSMESTMLAPSGVRNESPSIMEAN